jgi:hypothetical protein
MARLLPLFRRRPRKRVFQVQFLVTDEGSIFDTDLGEKRIASVVVDQLKKAGFEAREVTVTHKETIPDA